jgi:hypothetical protein
MAVACEVMATQLTKPVVRETNVIINGRPLVVTISPNGTISFREKGSRGPVSEFSTTLAACYHMAVKQEVLATKRAKAS